MSEPSIEQQIVAIKLAMALLSERLGFDLVVSFPPHGSEVVLRDQVSGCTIGRAFEPCGD